MSRLTTERLSLAYHDGTPVVRELDLALPDGRITAIIGPNGCGKSTLLRGVARLMKPAGGVALLDGRAIHSLSTKTVARQLALLPQGAVVPVGLTVSDLVARGRYPHQHLLRQWSREDERAVGQALEATGTADLRDRLIDELSGGQRQRVWIALVLAQDTPTLLLDEPTTFLDVAHQLEVLDLLRDLNEQHGRTIVLVLHDLNHAARYAHHIVAMADGTVTAAGTPRDVITVDTIRAVFGVSSVVIDDPSTGLPHCIPTAIARARPPVSTADSQPTTTGRTPT